MAALIPGSFVAKAEVAGWPLFGWLAKLQRTVFVDRQRRSTAHAARRDRAAGWSAGDNLILFPEGTSNDGNRVLPFRSALLGAAERGSVSLKARSGRAGADRAAGLARLYPAQRLSASAMRCGRASPGTATWSWPPICGDALGLGRVTVVVEFHPPVTIDEFGTRKALAEHCYAGRGRRRGRGAHRLRTPRQGAVAVPPAPREG